MRLLLFSLVCFCFFISCQKELSEEHGTPDPAAAAEFTFAGAPGACAAATNTGYFASGTTLTDENTVTLEVDVTRPGTYTITTNTANGYSFSASGSFTDRGRQTVVLQGTGTPVEARNDVFTPQAGSATGCTFAITVTSPSPAEYTLAGAPDACSNATVNGTYGINMPLTVSNTVAVQVNVTSIGTYTLTTNTVAGMSFSKTGAFTATGVQTVVLQGSGTPDQQGAQVFTPQVGTSSCTFTVDVIGAAAYTLGGAPGACTNATVNGTYTASTPLASTHTVTVEVDVTTAGAYHITTNTVGGMTFSKSGNFTTTGVQEVVLQGSGTPTAGTHTLAIANSGCTFDVTVAAAPAVASVFQCKIDGVLTTFTDRAHAETLNDILEPPIPYLYLDGYTGPPNGSNVPQLQIFISKNDNSVVGTGTYNEKSFAVMNGYRIEIDYSKVNPDLSVTLWNTSSNLLSANPPFTINVTKVTAERIQGTFSGKLTNINEGSTAQITISEGVFDLPIENP